MGFTPANPPTLWLRCRWSRGSALEPQGSAAAVHPYGTPATALGNAQLGRYTRVVRVAPDSSHVHPPDPPGKGFCFGKYLMAMAPSRSSLRGTCERIRYMV